jgi:hypothetical protein
VSVARAMRTTFGAEEAINAVPGLLRPIDTPVIAKRLQVERRGRERGARELPQTAEQQFDPVEREIVDEHIKEWS